MFLKDSDIIELHSEGAGDLEISEILGCSFSGVKYRREKLGLPKNPQRVRFRKMYAAYDRDTKEFMAQGSIFELSCILGLGETTLRQYHCRTKENSVPLPPILIYKVEEPEQ